MQTANRFFSGVSHQPRRGWIPKPDQNKDGGKVQIWDCVGGNNQLWTYAYPWDFDARTRRFISRSGKCLQVPANANRSAAQIWTCNASYNQNWVKRIDEGQPNSRVWFVNLMSMVDNDPVNKRCLDVHAPAANTNGGKVQVYSCPQENPNPNPFQQWDRWPRWP